MTLLLYMDLTGWAIVPVSASFALFLGGFAAARAAKAMPGQRRPGTGDSKQRRAEPA